MMLTIIQVIGVILFIILFPLYMDKKTEIQINKNLEIAVKKYNSYMEITKKNIRDKRLDKIKDVTYDLIGYNIKIEKNPLKKYILLSLIDKKTKQVKQKNRLKYKET